MKKRPRIWLRIVVVVLLIVLGVWVYGNTQQNAPTVVQENVNEEEVREQVAQNPETVVARGDFMDASVAYQGSGQASIVQLDGSAVLKFENFEVTPGPDLLVYLSPNAANEDLGEFVSLGALKSETGDQTYTLPDDYERYQTVVIWCRAFSVPFAMAELS